MNNYVKTYSRKTRLKDEQSPALSSMSAVSHRTSVVVVQVHDEASDIVGVS